MSETMTVRKAKDFKTSRWSGGSTTELYIYPEEAQYKEGNFKCRISSAVVEVEKSDFTSLPKVKRYLSIFSGQLDMVHGGEERISLKPYEVDCFDGGVPTVSFGKVVDFNLMLKNGADGKMEAARLNDKESMEICPREGENLLAVYVKTGSVRINGILTEAEELLVCKEWESALELVNEGEEEAGVGICRVRV